MVAEPPRTLAPMIAGCIALICRSFTVALVTRLSNVSARRSSAGVCPVSGIASKVRARPRGAGLTDLLDRRALAMRRIMWRAPQRRQPADQTPLEQAAVDCSRVQNP